MSLKYDPSVCVCVCADYKVRSMEARVVSDTVLTLVWYNIYPSVPSGTTPMVRAMLR